MKRALILSALLISMCLQGCWTINPFKDVPNVTATPQETTITDPPNVDPPLTPQYSYLSHLAQQYEEYLYLTKDSDPKYLYIINKIYNQFGKINSSYEPDNLVTLDVNVTRDGKSLMELDERVAKALYAMLAEMETAGIVDVRVTSGYRSYTKQSTLFNGYLEKEMSCISDEAIEYFGEAYIKENYTDQELTQLTREDAERVANYYSARPGESEHHTGLCFDLYSLTEKDFLSEDTAAYRWLEQNAHRFGFILRYRKDKSDVTGYMYEPWHFRYVGRDAATVMYEKNLTLEEFLGVI